MTQRDPANSPPSRRALLERAAAGSLLYLAGGCYRVAGPAADSVARSEMRADGRPRLPPGQFRIDYLKPMGGDQGNPDPSQFNLRIHGAVRKSLDINFKELLALKQVEQTCDVHCVTKWSLFDSRWTGVPLRLLADLAGVKDEAAHVIFEAAYGYTANIPLQEALAEDVLVAHRFAGDPLGEPHGAPVRALVPGLYFWKSAKWLTGIRFEREDESGYWEVRGYHNHGDPWLEERYS